jgi:hypothetical protein
MTGLASSANAQQDALFVDSQGNVGIGLESPKQALHIFRDGQGATTVPLLLENPDGKLRFLLSSNGEGWTFDNVLGNSFDISRVGTGSAEFQLRESGNLTIAGTLSEGSSRAMKTAIQPVDPTDVLSKLDQVEVAEWSYKGASETRHLGPMAETFYQTYNLGPDNEHIAPKDMAGVAMASAKALKEKVAEQQERLTERDERIDELEKRLSRLEKKLSEK